MKPPKADSATDWILPVTPGVLSKVHEGNGFRVSVCECR